MSWWMLSLFSAVFQALTDVISKKKLQRLSSGVVAFSLAAGSTLFLTIIVVPASNFHYSSSFLLLTLLASVLDAIALLLYLRAIQIGDLSLVLPLKMFTPLFLLFTSPLMLGEYASQNGIIGVMLIMVGSYILNTSGNQTGFLSPVRALLSYRPSQLMLLGAAIFGINCNIHKSAIELSSPLQYAYIHQLMMSILLLPLFLKELKPNIRIELTQSAQSLLIVGLCVALSLVFHMTAMQTGLVVYTVAIKRTSILMSVCIAYFFLGEGNIIERMAGTCVMLTGVVVTAL